MSFVKDFEDIDLNMHGVRLPSFEVALKDKRSLGVSEDIDNEEFLKALCEKGMADLGLEGERYQERFEYEFKTVKELGFIDYLLLVWEVVNYCKKEDIPTGVGRGSAAGCLLLYSMGVTKIDPIKYELFLKGSYLK